MLFNCSQPEVMAEALKVAHEAKAVWKLVFTPMHLNR